VSPATATLEPPEDGLVAAPPEVRAALPPLRRSWVWYRSPGLAVPAWIVSLTGMIGYAVWVYQTAPHGFVDLAVYRFGIRAWWHGGDLYGHLPATVAGHLPYVYPPITAVILAPLNALTWDGAIIATLVASLLALIVVVYLTFLRVFPGAGRRGALLAAAALTPVALSLEPVWDTLWYGQINIVLAAMVLIDCFATSKRWPRGVLIGVAAAIKLTPAVFLLYFLLRKDFRSASRLVISTAVVTAAGFAVNWGGSVKYWFGASGGARSISGSPFYTNQTVDGLLARWGLTGPPQTAIWLACALVLLAGTVLGVHRAGRLGDTPLAVVITAGFGLVVSPTSWSNHWVYVAPALIVLAGHVWRQRGPLWGPVCVAVGAVFGLAPFLYLPLPATGWTPLQQIPGNAFLITGVVLLIGFALPDVPVAWRAARVRLGRHPSPVPCER
jgi:alpha-1,2-mannosyltransferase